MDDQALVEGSVVFKDEDDPTWGKSPVSHPQSKRRVPEQRHKRPLGLQRDGTAQERKRDAGGRCPRPYLPSRSSS